MANGLEMLYNAIGGAGSTLSGHLRETELRRLQVEAELRAQAERDALLERTNRELADFDKKYSDTKSQAQDLGMQLPAPGSIDDQIFRATGGFARIPGLSPGMPMAPGGGTQLPVASPRTEWAPSQAEAAVSADAIRATKELLSGKSAVDTDRFFKRLELVQGAQRRAASRPSTSGMSATLGDQAKGLSDFMTREGVIANDGRNLQSGIAGKFMDNRALSARDRQGTEYKEAKATARNNANNAVQKQIADARLEHEKKVENRLEDKELRLQQAQLISGGKLGEAIRLQKFNDVKAVEAGDLSKSAFLQKYPTAKIASTWHGGVFGQGELTGLNTPEADAMVSRALLLLPEYQDELARRAGAITPPSSTPSITPVGAVARNPGNLNIGPDGKPIIDW